MRTSTADDACDEQTASRRQRVDERVGETPIPAGPAGRVGGRPARTFIVDDDRRARHREVRLRRATVRSADELAAPVAPTCGLP